MSTVLDVSTVDLCAAEANLVVVTPQTLKKAIETIIPNVYTRIIPLSAIYAKA